MDTGSQLLLNVSDMDTGSQLLLNVSTLQGTVKLGSKATEIVA